jgi:photosystem II stability/assembly factor-like uncharacterized protein
LTGGRRGTGRLFFTGLLALAVGLSAQTFRWQAQNSETTARLRGVSAVSALVAWASGANGTLLRTVNGGAAWTKLAPPAGAEKLDFRDIDAFSDRVAYALSIGSGDTSRIYKTTDGGVTWALQFANTDPKVFLDAMAFRDADHGFAFSDSVDGQFVILATTNGGSSWERIPANRLPPALPGEGAFAASGTNVSVIGSNVWIGTTASRVLRSADSGRTWAIATTPIATGNATGIFSIAFRDTQRGVVVGGDYTKESQAGDNAAFTTDGGATWTLAKGITGFRSVAAWLPGSASMIAIGPTGADWSVDDGHSWTPSAISPATAPAAGFDTVSFASSGQDAVGWATGSGGRISRLTVAAP